MGIKSLCAKIVDMYVKMGPLWIEIVLEGPI